MADGGSGRGKCKIWKFQPYSAIFGFKMDVNSRLTCCGLQQKQRRLFSYRCAAARKFLTGRAAGNNYTKSLRPQSLSEIGNQSHSGYEVCCLDTIWTVIQGPRKGLKTRLVSLRVCSGPTNTIVLVILVVRLRGKFCQSYGHVSSRQQNEAR